MNLSVGLSPEDLKHAVQSSDALIIRSATKVSCHDFGWTVMSCQRPACRQDDGPRLVVVKTTPAIGATETAFVRPVHGIVRAGLPCRSRGRSLRRPGAG